MCGLAGLMTTDRGVMLQADQVASRMASALTHRGPDDSGIWKDEEAGVALAHRRLSILDLSPAGHQPMRSATGRYILAFNGEIYNHHELRHALEREGVDGWRGHSDTETLLAAIERWGLDRTLARAVGMFALAIWDSSARSLALARDRFGEKPLYYGWVGTGFVFASELKALKAYPGFSNDVSVEALDAYLNLMYVPAPLSIYSGIFKLEPGCILRVTGEAPSRPPTIPLAAPSTYQSLVLDRWWSLSEMVETARAAPILDEREGIERTEQSLSEAIRLQSLADVPVGAFLSGGVDSSVVVALMQRQARRPVKTYTIGFESLSFNEAPFAREVSTHLGTDHTEIVVTAKDALALVPDLPAVYDEPFADSSQVPTLLVCKSARDHVSVALSGDAGDELFGGYNRYVWAPLTWNRISWLPFLARRVLGGALTSLPLHVWDRVGVPASGIQRQASGVQHLGIKAHKLGRGLKCVASLDDLYDHLVSSKQEFLRVGPKTAPLLGSRASLPPPHGAEDAISRMMYWDAMTYLPGDILCKVDRAAMSVSLETRVPMLDHRVAETAWRLPNDMKVRGRQGKWVLREILKRHVPAKLIDRPKAGFAIPLGDWLRGPLRPWAESLLAADAIDKDGYFSSTRTRELWSDHLIGRDHTQQLWAILMFQAWLGMNR